MCRRCWLAPDTLRGIDGIIDDPSWPNKTAALSPAGPRHGRRDGLCRPGPIGSSQVSPGAAATHPIRHRSGHLARPRREGRRVLGVDAALHRVADELDALLVEAELGFIGKSSKMLDEVPEGVGKITPEEAEHFVSNTGVDLFAPAVGNVHGIVRGGREPKLDIELIKSIAEAVKIPLVLHGASGNTDEEIRAAIEAGISIIHINTELRLAYRQGLVKSLSENPDELAPYKYLKPALQEMQKVAEKKLRLFNHL